MKKRNIVLGLTVIIISSIFIISCGKKIDEPQPKRNTHIMTESMITYNKIVSFKEKIQKFKENDNLITKSIGESLDIDSTVWYLEAATNLTEADANIRYNVYIKDSAFITVQHVNGKVNWSEILTAYYAISDSINVIYDNIKEEDKQLYVADLSIYKSSINTVIMKLTTILTKTVGITNKSSNVAGNWLMWGENRGYCNGFNGSPTADASDYIADYLNSTISIPSGWVATNVEIKTVYAGMVQRPSPVTTNYGTSSSYLYWENNPDLNYIGACFSPMDINLFTDGLTHIETMFRPPYKEILHYELNDYRSNWTTPYVHVYLDHWTNLTYCMWAAPSGGGGGGSN